MRRSRVRVDTMIASIGRVDRFNQTTHVDKEPRFVVFSNPISARPRLKASPDLSVARAQVIAFEITGGDKIGQQRLGISGNSQEGGYDRSERMLDDPRHTEWIREHLGMPVGTPLEESFAIEASSEAVTKGEDLRDPDSHWRFQRKPVFFDLVPELTVGEVENSNPDAHAASAIR